MVNRKKECTYVCVSPGYQLYASHTVTRGSVDDCVRWSYGTEIILLANAN